MFYPGPNYSPFGVNAYNPYSRLGYGPQRSCAQPQGANSQNNNGLPQGCVNYPAQSNAPYFNSAGNSSFAYQHPDMANEFTHACRHLLMERAESLQDVLPTATQAGRVWLQAVQDRLLLKQQQEQANARNNAIAPSVSVEPTVSAGSVSTGIDAARTMASDLARQAPRFMI